MEIQKNICPFCNEYIPYIEDIDGYYCKNCKKMIDDTNVDYLQSLEEANANEYHIPTTDENLKGLNNL